MNQTPATFWEHVFDLRERGQIPRVWKTGQLSEFLEHPIGPYSPGTVTTDPFNYSISMRGDKIGYFVQKGQAPKAWRVGRGQFRLIADPEDDMQTQEAERSRAVKRAAELRSQKRQTNGHPVGAAIPPLDHPERPSLQAESAPGSSELYPAIIVALTPTQRQALAGRSTEQKAMFIVHTHLASKYGGQVEIEEDHDGADLRVYMSGKSERIEVKGTESPTIAWPKLKVSSQKSHDALRNGETSMYRVVDVSGANPRIYILTYGRHFTLEPEPRWAVKRVTPKDDRYPMRGEPYRYDLPYDPVATDEWEARG